MKIDFAKIIKKYKDLCSPEIRKSTSINKFVEKLENELSSEKCNINEIKIADAIDNIIKSNRGDKKKLVDFISGFCKFVYKEEKLKLEPSVLDAEIIDDPTERRLRMACFLHIPRATEEIVCHFFQDERTVRKDLKALKEGISFMGQQIQIQAVRKNKKVQYVSTLHPVFLPLNLTEVYALTAGLLNVVHIDNPLYEIYSYLARFVYSQLSEYGRGIIHNSAAESEIYLPPADSRRQGSYRDERMLVEMRGGAFVYMLKRGESCDVEYIENGEKKKVRGKLKYNPVDDKNSIGILTEQNTFTIGHSQIISIKPVKYN